MGNNEIFEFCETSSKRQCSDCACTCGKVVQPTAMNRQYNKDRLDTLSIPGYVTKKNQSRGPRHGQSMRQIMYHKARDMLRKAKLPKNGSCETTLERWHTDADCQKLLSSEGWTEEKIKEYDAVALEDHSYEATPQERVRLAKELRNCIEQRRSAWSEKTTTCFPWSEARFLSTIQRTCVESTGQRNQSIHPAQKKKTQSSLGRSRGVQLQGSPSNWMEILSFNKFVFILAVAAEQ